MFYTLESSSKYTEQPMTKSDYIELARRLVQKLDFFPIFLNPGVDGYFIANSSYAYYIKKFPKIEVTTHYKLDGDILTADPENITDGNAHANIPGQPMCFTLSIPHNIYIITRFRYPLITNESASLKLIPLVERNGEFFTPHIPNILHDRSFCVTNLAHIAKPLNFASSDYLPTLLSNFLTSPMNRDLLPNAFPQVAQWKLSYQKVEKSEPFGTAFATYAGNINALYGQRVTDEDFKANLAFGTLYYFYHLNYFDQNNEVFENIGGSNT